MMAVSDEQYYADSFGLYDDPLSKRHLSGEGSTKEATIIKDYSVR
jgi:hypothetical protein